MVEVLRLSSALKWTSLHEVSYKGQPFVDDSSFLMAVSLLTSNNRAVESTDMVKFSNQGDTISRAQSLLALNHDTVTSYEK